MVGMRKKTTCFLWPILILTAVAFAAPQDSVIKNDIVTISVEQQYEAVKPDSNSALAVLFDTKQGWHFYANENTAPGGMNLKLTPSSEKFVNFSVPIFPRPHSYYDRSLDQKLNVFSDKFTVFLPFEVSAPDLKTGKATDIVVKISIEGAVCSDIQCRVPDFGQLSTTIKIATDAPMDKAKFALPQQSKSSSKPPAPVGKRAAYSFWFALGLAFLAGLSLNIMPCVWPVLPLAVLRIVEQAKLRTSSKLTMGIAFCIGILLFFACLAAANIILRVSFDTTLQWGDQFRNPIFIKVMALVLVVLALFMFDVFSFTLPGSISGSTGSGHAGTIGMGFLAALLSTPCSFAILAAAFAWAQAQPLLPATVAIMVIGIGMAVPYLVLVSIPGLLESLPAPGKWMDIFKKTVGFILLAVAVWMITVVPQERRTGVLFYSLVLAFCVWMWGGWVGFGSKTSGKIIVRTIAVLLAVGTGYWLLSPPPKMIDWQKYDPGLIEKSLSDNKPVLIKFTADWCLSCKAVEKLVYERKDVAELLKQKGVVVIKADTTAKDYPATKALKDIYNEPGVPVTILIVPGRSSDTRWRDKTFGDELKAILEKLPSK
jgi:thiol:disulfide interchange protein